MNIEVISKIVAPVLFKRALIDCVDVDSITTKELLTATSEESMKELVDQNFKPLLPPFVSQVVTSTGITSKIPAYKGHVDENSVIAFVILIGTAAKLFSLTADDFANMDESGIFLAQIFLQLYSAKDKRIRLFKLPHQKTRITVVACGTAAGRKFPPHIICDNTPNELHNRVISVDPRINVYDFAKNIAVDKKNGKILPEVEAQNEHVNCEHTLPSTNNESTQPQITNTQVVQSSLNVEQSRAVDDDAGDDDEIAPGMPNPAEFSEPPIIDLAMNLTELENEELLHDEFSNDRRFADDLVHMDLEAIFLSADVATSIYNKAAVLYRNNPPPDTRSTTTRVRAPILDRNYYLAYNSPMVPYLEKILEEPDFCCYAHSFRKTYECLMAYHGTPSSRPADKVKTCQDYLSSMILGPPELVQQILRHTAHLDTDAKARARAIELLNDPYVQSVFLHSPLIREPPITQARVTRQPRAWMDTEGFKGYIQHESQNPSKPRVLIMDNCPSHVSKESVACIEKSPLLCFLLPKNMTDRLQPMDLAVNAPLKSNMRRITLHRYNYCVTNNTHGREASYLYKWHRTVANYMEAWNSVKPESVQNGFRKMFTELLDYFGVKIQEAHVVEEEKRKVSSRKHETWKFC